MPSRSGDETFCSLVEHVVCALIYAWEPQLVLVSAGFDAHRDDPLATCRVTEAGYARMTSSLRAAAGAVGAPLGIVLEGGYDLHALAESMATLLPVLTGDAVLPSSVVPVHPLVTDAARRLGHWWPSLAAGTGPE